MKLEGISSLTMNNDINNTEEKQWVEIAICKKIVHVHIYIKYS